MYSLDLSDPVDVYCEWIDACEAAREGSSASNTNTTANISSGTTLETTIPTINHTGTNTNTLIASGVHKSTVNNNNDDDDE